jgi:transcriptional regulator with XRE-family HTH domain
MKIRLSSAAMKLASALPLRAPLADSQMTITGAQIIIARGLLGWSRAKLAVESNVDAYIIAGFENATRPLSDTAIDQLRQALEAAGVIFMMSKSGVTLATEVGMPITGAQLKAAHELLGWSQIKLTLASGIDGGAIGRFETGERLPPRSVGIALSRTLKSAGVIFCRGERRGAWYQTQEGAQMTVTVAQFRAGARHLLQRSRPALADQWSVLIYSIDGGAESREVMNDFPSTLAVKAFRENAARHILYVLVPVHATARQRGELWECGATLCI